MRISHIHPLSELRVTNRILSLMRRLPYHHGGLLDLSFGKSMVLLIHRTTPLLTPCLHIKLGKVGLQTLCLLFNKSVCHSVDLCKQRVFKTSTSSWATICNFFERAKGCPKRLSEKRSAWTGFRLDISSKESELLGFRPSTRWHFSTEFPLQSCLILNRALGVVNEMLFYCYV